MAGDVDVQPWTADGVPGERVRSRSIPARGSLYLHGGGFVSCSPQTHRPITVALARLGFEVFVPDYRLAPEHPFPAGLEDAQRAYLALRRELPDPSRLVIAGDSAGGGLALSLLLALKRDNQPLPRAARCSRPSST